MVDSFRDIVSYAEKHTVNNRIGAYMRGLRDSHPRAVRLAAHSPHPLEKHARGHDWPPHDRNAALP
jgi:hypothetical protein